MLDWHSGLSLNNHQATHSPAPLPGLVFPKAACRHIRSSRKASIARPSPTPKMKKWPEKSFSLRLLGPLGAPRLPAVHSLGLGQYFILHIVNNPDWDILRILEHNDTSLAIHPGHQDIGSNFNSMIQHQQVITLTSQVRW